jgi:p-aminobenzoyl-glutamate transporter AbgT
MMGMGPYIVLAFFAAQLITFALVWSALLGLWVAAGWEPGPGGPLIYAP